MRKKIAIYTGNRAEYGLLFPIIKAIADHPLLEYYLLVSGAHLQEDFGLTKLEIERDGFHIYREIKMRMDQDTLFGTAQAIGSGILNLCKTLDKIRPDFFVIYADRFESFSAMIAGTQMNIPTAHIEGGDLTEGGALDDSVRHAMTKLAHIHFTTNEAAAARILRLGEEPWRVYNVGLPILDLISDGLYASPEELNRKFGLAAAKPVVLFTQHSVTTEFEKAAAQVKPSLAAMEQLADQDDCQIIITYPNNDAGGRLIISEIEKLRSKNLKGIQVHKSLGRYNYHGIINLCGMVGRGVCVGNSSSGIKETAIFGCPVVNIGSRQRGRLRAENVLDTDYDTQQILSACRKSLFDNEYRNICLHVKNPYGIGKAGQKIAEVLAGLKIEPGLLQKKMTY